MNAEIAPKAATASLKRPAGVVRFHGFEVDFERGELHVDGRPAALRPKTFALLGYLVSQAGRLVSKDQLMDALWPQVIVTDDSLVQCIGELRAALGEHHGVVRTVPRRGYMLDAAPLVESAPAQTLRSPEAQPVQPGGTHWPALAALVLFLVALLSWGAWRVSGNGNMSTITERRSIAVLPLKNLSGDSAQAYFVDGITADVIADLSRLPDTVVIAQGSTQRYKEQIPDARQVGRELAVRFVMSGSVLRSGEDLRINVWLFSADSGAVLFSDTMDYGADRPWSWRRDIGPRVAHALDIRIIDVVGGWKPEAPSAHDAVEHMMRGYAVLRRAALPSDFESAAAEFAAALRREPSSATAWAGLSMSRSGTILMRHVREPAAMLAEADAAAKKAMSLDPSAPNAHYAHGQVLLLRGNLEAALEAFQQALRLNPSLTFAHARVAVILIELGRAAEALDHARMALRLSPYDASLVALGHFAAGMALFHVGRDEESYAEMQKMVAADPRIGFAYQWMAAIDALHGRGDRARENLTQYRRLIAIQTIQGLKATERSHNSVFLAQRERFYDGLRRAGLPER